MKSGRATSLEHAVELMFDGSFRPDLQRYRSNYAFRGMSDGRHVPTTGLARLGGPYARLEEQILQSFAKYAETTPYAAKRSPWNWITVAQHHGLPTRLLDWTWSPLVALHFATSDLEKMAVDARVWGIDVVNAHKLLPERISRKLLGRFVPTIELMDDVAPTLREFDDFGNEFILFFEPPSLDERIVNQYAFFSVMPGAQLSVDDWMQKNATLCRSIEIPANIKWQIRDKLDSMNINERVLFPGLDGIAQWLKRYYSPGPPKSAQ